MSGSVQERFSWRGQSKDMFGAKVTFNRSEKNIKFFVLIIKNDSFLTVNSVYKVLPEIHWWVEYIFLFFINSFFACLVIFHALSLSVGLFQN